jgi:hypothetical protein
MFRVYKSDFCGKLVIIMVSDVAQVETEDSAFAVFVSVKRASKERDATALRVLTNAWPAMG